MDQSMAKARTLRVAVIGAGASGIVTAIKLREIGISDIAIFEKATDLGGTWRDNSYPGLACDVPSHLYRYSFAPNPEWGCGKGCSVPAHRAMDHAAAQCALY